MHRRCQGCPSRCTVFIWIIIHHVFGVCTVGVLLVDHYDDEMCAKKERAQDQL